MTRTLRSSSPQPPKSLLVLALAGIGDTILATPMIGALRGRLGSAQIDALVMWPESAEVLSATGRLDAVHQHDFIHASKTASLAMLRELRRARYDVTVLAFPSNRAHYNLLAFLIGSPQRLGHSYFLGSSLAYARFLLTETVAQRGHHCVEENLALAAALGAETPDASCTVGTLGQGATTAVDAWLVAQKRPVVVLHPGCSPLKNQDQRRWAPEHFVALSRRLVDEEGVSVLVLLGREEQVLRPIFEGDEGDVLAVLESSSLAETASAMRRCHLLVASDSSMVHLSAALGLASVVIFGPTNEAYVRPWRVPHRIVRHALPCAPCFEYGAKPLRCVAQRGFECVRGISVDEVVSACHELLAERRPTSGRPTLTAP